MRPFRRVRGLQLSQGVRVGSVPKQEERGQVDESRRRFTEWEAAGAFAHLPFVLSQAGQLFHFCGAYTLSGWRLGSNVRSVNTALIVKRCPPSLL